MMMIQSQQDENDPAEETSPGKINEHGFHNEANYFCSLRNPMMKIST
jgi:hypothetical protein